ncbi:glycosyltransferase family 4 protein [Hyphomicrobium sp.]|jgi:glycosyltransferase involved in cell wall biosynthesis|uniref:glycosyltransferase family 4 protein n=1 Tax=Hyphomicrobium sp. TaxID=82 RepID=UPI002C4ED299|nr:glycosyltransferase family 4 protein [Hyphomicrobium sp.]HVZ04344.1 glycosyltransferase family 4 protein [Hyphomicrobium sp.]
MRILHCLRAPVGGLFRHVLDVVEEQANRGHDVGILADSNAEDTLTATKFAAISSKLSLGIARIPMPRQPGIGDITAVRAVWSHARKLDLDVLHGHGAKGGAYARLAARSLSIRGRTVKSFYTPHGGSLNLKPGSIEQRVLMMIERALESMTTGLIFESAHAARVYRERISAKGAPQRVISNGLKPADFASVEPHPDASDVLFVGELRDLKGIDVLLLALAEMKDRGVTATIVGSGPDETRFKAMSSALGLDERVRFTGALPIREAFALGRIMVVPSRAESFPYVVLEAAAASLPLIATNVGGIPEIVAETDTPLIEAGSVSAIVASLTFGLDNPETLRARAETLRQKVGQKFTVTAMTDAILSFYGVLSERPGLLTQPTAKLQSHRG